MKKILLSTMAMLAFAVSYAQLPNNSICPDFTGTDLDGVEWNLYSLLDAGKPVIIEVSAAWCAPCWEYHQSHNLKNFYEQYGPEGTNEAMVIFIEGEAQNTTAQLHGPAGGSGAMLTQGDWVTGTPFPIIDDASIGDLLEIGYFPTIYLICPDRIVTEIGQVTTAEAYAAVTDANCSLATETIDPRFLSLSTTAADCQNETASIFVNMQNKGTEALTAATITVTGAGTPIVYDWTGNLATYETAEVEITGIEADPAVTVSVAVTSTDNVPANSTGELEVSTEMTEATTHIRMVFTNDPWPSENTWKIKNASGTTVYTSPAFTDSNPPVQTTTTYNTWVPSTGCYTFEFTDAYGDGLNGSLWGTGANYFDGSLMIYSVDANGNTTLLYGNDGSEPMGEEAQVSVTHYTPFMSNSVVSTEEINTISSAFNVYPNPASGLVNLNYTLTRDSDVLVDVINSVGVRVMSEKLGSQKHGTYNTAFDLSSLAAGVYMVNLNADGVISTVRVIVK